MLVRAGRIRAAVRRDLERGLAPWLTAARLELGADAEPMLSGRGAAYRMTLPTGQRAVVRFYRRGGALARLVRETYLGVRARPLRELLVTVETRRRGVPTVEVLAARVEGRFVHRGALVTGELAAPTLLEALREAPDERTRCALSTSAGRTVGALHAAGVSHPDLNLTNLLVRSGAGGAYVVLCDFDRARLGRKPLQLRARRQNLRRLRRSQRKLDPNDELLGVAEQRAFRAGYQVVLGLPCAC